MKPDEIQLVPEGTGQPLFKTAEEYRQFRENYMAEVIPKLEELRMRRLLEQPSTAQICEEICGTLANIPAGLAMIGTTDGWIINYEKGNPEHEAFVARFEKL